MNLVRMGVCNASGRSLMNSPRIIRGDVAPRKEAVLRKYYSRVSGALAQGPARVFALCTEIFGDQGCRLLHDTNQFPSCPRRNKRPAEPVAGPSRTRRRVA